MNNIYENVVPCLLKILKTCSWFCIVISVYSYIRAQMPHWWIFHEGSSLMAAASLELSRRNQAVYLRSTPAWRARGWSAARAGPRAPPQTCCSWCSGPPARSALVVPTPETRFLTCSDAVTRGFAKLVRNIISRCGW